MVTDPIEMKRAREAHSGPDDAKCDIVVAVAVGFVPSRGNRYNQVGPQVDSFKGGGGGGQTGWSPCVQVIL